MAGNKNRNDQSLYVPGEGFVVIATVRGLGAEGTMATDSPGRPAFLIVSTIYLEMYLYKNSVHTHL